MGFRDSHVKRGFAAALAQMNIKTAGLGDLLKNEHFAEVAGLGTLAIPTVHKMITGEEPSDLEKHVSELGGLGILAAHPLKHLLSRPSGGSTASPMMPTRVP